MVRTARHAGSAGLAYVLEGIVQNGGFCAAAWLMIAVWARGTAPTGRASRREIAAAALCLLALVPSRQASIAGLIALGVQLAGLRGTGTGRRVAALLLALALNLGWTSPYVLPLHAAVARLDARAVQALLHLVGVGARGGGNLVDSGSAGFGIEILARCASSYPFGGVCLAFIVTMLYQGRMPGRHDLPWRAASLLASMGLTELRLSWMTLREADFMWLHDGGGVTLYSLAGSALAALFPLLAARRGTARRSEP